MCNICRYVLLLAQFCVDNDRVLYVYFKNIADKYLTSTVASEVNKVYILYFQTNVT